jgi:hypothetical protein
MWMDAYIFIILSDNVWGCTHVSEENAMNTVTVPLMNNEIWVISLKMELLVLFWQIFSYILPYCTVYTYLLSPEFFLCLPQFYLYK